MLFRSDARHAALLELARIASVQFFGEHAQIVEDLALMRFGDAIDVGLGEL